MRILHVMYSLDERSGGPIRAVVDLSLSVRAHGIECEILGFGQVSIRASVPGELIIHSLPLRFPERYYYSPELRSWINANLDRFDGIVIHGMWNYANRLFARACRRTAIPYAYFPHGMFDPWAIFGQGLFKALKKMVYWAAVERVIIAGASYMFFTTERERHLAIAVLRLRTPSALIAPYYWTPLNGEAKSVPEHGAIVQPEGRRIALFLGRLDPKKNVEFLIRAWHQAAPPHEWHLIVAGAGPRGYTGTL